MPSFLIAVQYCYDYLVNRISLGLLLYAHLPTAITALVFGIFIFLKTKKLNGAILLGICLSFALWALGNLLAWFGFLGSSLLMFGWSILDIWSVLFFLFSYYFLYTFIKEKDLPFWQKAIGFILLLPNLYWIITSTNLNTYDLNICEAYESETVLNYNIYFQVLFMCFVIGFVIKEFLFAKTIENKRKITMAGTGIVLFLFCFTSGIFAERVASLLDIVVYSYNVEIYALFGMPILLIFLGSLIVKYQIFDIKVFASQGLIIALIALVAAQFAFVHDEGGMILTAITLAIVFWIGRALIRSVRKEIELREHLEEANKGQANLIHIMNHQIKNYLAKSRNIFAELMSDPSYGVESEAGRSIIKSGFDSLTEGVGFVQQILNGSSAEKGTLVYNKNPIDLRHVVAEASTELETQAKEKGLSYEVSLEEGVFTVNGDKIHLKEAIKNLIDNSIKYTLKGGLVISLKKQNSAVRLTVHDTGVGILPEDKKRLFTKGGRGKDSLKINVHSTGYGLSFVKGVTEAHGGKVWAESEGKDKGATFILELPLA